MPFALCILRPELIMNESISFRAISSKINVKGEKERGDVDLSKKI